MSKKCKFYQAGNCKSGNDCRFLHEIESEKQVLKKQPIVVQLIKKSNTVDAKTAELTQLERRFRSTFLKISKDDSKEIVEFDLAPSDPDFPFELDALKITLTVFHDYPTTAAEIKIRNSEIPLELISRVEEGWKLHADSNRSTILLDQFKWLDRNLEQLLISKADKEEEPEIQNSAIRFFKPEEIKVSSKTEELEELEEIMHSTEIIKSLDIQEEQVNKASISVSKNTHKGTQIRVPKVQLVNIGLLKCTSLAISLYCPRCKGTIDARLLPNSLDIQDGIGEVWLCCPVCSLSVGTFYIIKI